MDNLEQYIEKFENLVFVICLNWDVIFWHLGREIYRLSVTHAHGIAVRC